MPHIYSVALFDILGFEERFSVFGLDGIAAKYKQLIASILRRNHQSSEVAAKLHLEDEATWTADGDVFIFNRVHGAYASDTILIWAHALFPEARSLAEEERAARASEPATGWKFLPIPCDRFLEACSEVVCESLELELPVRGAITMGRAIFDSKRGVFLGQPIIDAARIEKDQKLIGASIGGSYLSQTIPGPYALPMQIHVKASSPADFSGLVLNWPRHWRVTRQKDLASTISRLNTSPAHSRAYENSLELHRQSEIVAREMHTDHYISTRAVYSQFSSPDLKVGVRAVRGAPVA